MTLRDFIFILWTQSGETQAGVVTALKLIASNQYNTTLEGGKVLVSANVNGQSYNYNVGQGLNPMQIAGYARRGYMAIKDMTDAELETYLLTEDERFSTAVFNNLDVQ